MAGLLAAGSHHIGLMEANRSGIIALLFLLWLSVTSILFDPECGVSIVVVLQIEIVVALAAFSGCAIFIVILGVVISIIDLVAAIDVRVVGAAILVVLVEAQVVVAELVGQISPLTIVGSGDTVTALLRPLCMSVYLSIPQGARAIFLLVFIIDNVGRLLSGSINEALG